MFTTDSAGSSGQGTPRREGEGSSARTGEASGDLFPGRISSRRGNRLDDLEDLMMMEAIRLSLAAEEERKKREEKEAAKDAKKEGKKKAKENKKIARAQRNIGSGFHPIDVEGLDESEVGGSAAAGKGKGVDRSAGPNDTSSKEDSQRHLEDSRAQIQREASGSSNLAPVDAFNDHSSHRSALRNLSNASSSASSFAESYQNSLRQDSQNNLAPGSAYGVSPNASGVSLSQGETPPQGTPGTEPMFNFQSLAEAITPEEGKEDSPQHIEDVQDKKANESKTPTTSRTLFEHSEGSAAPNSESLGESMMTLKPTASSNEDDDEITPAPRVQVVTDDNSFEHKQLGNVSMVDRLTHHQATQ